MEDHQRQVRDQDIERLFAEHAQALYAFVVYRTGDRSVAEEVVGDTFERLVATRRRFDARKGGERNWVYTIALNLLRDQQRRAGSERRALDTLKHDYAIADADDPLARVEDRDRLYRALSTLKPEEREVLALRYGADLRLKDIAKLTQTPVSTVHERLQRGLRDLHQQLEDPPATAATAAPPPPPPPSQRSRTSRSSTRHDR